MATCLWQFMFPLLIAVALAYATRAEAQVPALPPPPVGQPVPTNPVPLPMMPRGGPVSPTQVPLRFSFKFDAKAPLSEFLPAAPKTAAKVPIWSNEDLAKVAELSFGDPLASTLEKKVALQKIAHALAKVNHLNRKKTDGFMLALIEQRGDLRGLPFRMGDECRTRAEQARTFREVASLVNSALAQGRGNNLFPAPAASSIVAPTSSTILPDGTNVVIGGDPVIVAAQNTVSDEMLWATMGNLNALTQRNALNGSSFSISSKNKDQVSRALVAALMQILMPETESLRLGLAGFLSTVPQPEATQALAKLAIFSPEESVRAAALAGLKSRREKDYTEVLMQGFTYPLPAVSKRAAEALVKLERKDLVENLVRVLESPDPRLPATRKQAGKEVTVVRELVKINHHRNCALCHSPGNTEGIPDGVLTVALPLPGEPLPKPSQGGYQSTPPASPDIVVRLDTTYLRQDFSVMMPVANHEPWPEMQRFDFLVRTRTLSASEAQAYEACCEEDEPGRLSPYHRSALFALRELTGRDTEPTAAAWRKLLKLPKS